MISRAKLASMLDHSVLRPESTEEDIRTACKLARELNVAAVVVNPAHIPIVVADLRGSVVKACSVISFPFGLSTTEAKLAETKHVIALGAEEIDVVMNFSALRSGRQDYVSNEIRKITETAKDARRQVVVKVILETCYLTEPQKRESCLLAMRAGVDFVKTSTGFGSAGATVEDVRLMRQTVGPKMGVKAAGGIRTAEQALQMVEAGANRIGTSSSSSILQRVPP